MFDPAGSFAGPRCRCASATGIALALLAAPARAQDSNAALAEKLNNPVAALISVPLQFNHDTDIGPARQGSRTTLNVQPVVPVNLSDDWNLISRTIVPLVSQQDIFPGAGSQSGLGDIVQSVFFSPKAPTAGGWIWGAGPVALLPTGSDPLLSARKSGIGPTGVVLKQDGGWSYGLLANHLWSIAGSGRDISATFLQPFVAYATSAGTTYAANTESTYEWTTQQWTVPLQVSVSQIVKVGSQLLSVGGGLRYWAESPDSGPHGMGVRVTVTLLFPR